MGDATPTNPADDDASGSAAPRASKAGPGGPDAGDGAGQTPLTASHASDYDEYVDDSATPGFEIGRRQLTFGVVAVIVIAAVLYVGLPLVPGIEESFGRIRTGQPLWLAASFGFAGASFAGYVLMFRGVYKPGGNGRVDLAASYQITMAGLAATRLFAAGGAGGLVLTAWALRQSGMDRRAVADRTVTFLALMYAPYMLAIVVGGMGMYYGLFPGSTTFGITMLPALLGIALIVLALLAALVPSDLERRIAHWGERGGRRARIAHKLANLPASASAGVRGAFGHLRRGDPASLGAVVYWAAQVAALWAAFRAFGAEPPVAVVTVGFFVGMLGNLLPLPGGIGGVDGGMIAALTALGQPGGVVVAAVLTYRVFAFWLPTVPGFIAYFQLLGTVRRWREDRASERSRHIGPESSATT